MIPSTIVYSATFNSSQALDCFVVGMNNGIGVYSADPLVDKRTIPYSVVGSVKYVSLLRRTNLIAFVGGGSQAKFPENTVLVYDDAKQKFVLEFTFASSVHAVHMSYTRLVVMLRRQLHVFSFPNGCQRLCTVETRDNPHGLCQVSADPHCELLVFPGRKLGSVQLVDLAHLRKDKSVSPVSLSAHQSDIAALALSNHASLLATGSVTGTMIRVFDSKSKILLSEFRRGSDPANLYSLRFSPCADFLCVSSDKGTVHVFAVRDKQSNRKSLLQQVGVVTEEAQRSLAQFSLPNQSVCAFGSSSAGKPSIIAICMDGTYHKFSFTMDGSCNREAFDYFTDLGNDHEFWNVSSSAGE